MIGFRIGAKSNGLRPPLTRKSNCPMSSIPNEITAFQAGIQEERQRMRFLIDLRVDQLKSIPSLKNRMQLCEELWRLRQYCDLA